MKMYHFQKDCGPGFTTMADGVEEAKKNVLNYMKKEDKKDHQEGDSKYFEEWGFSSS